MSSRPQRFRRRAPIVRTTAAALLILAGLASTPHAGASSGVQCGDRLTRDTVLTKDLYCQKDGLKIGAHGITLDLGGHDIIGPGKPGTKGIQNSGYDNVVIDGYAGGTVRGFDHGIELRNGAHGNEIVGFYAGGVRGGTYGLVLFDSDRARVDDNVITAGRWKDGYDGGFGAAFALYRSHDNWFEENFSERNGVNVVVLDNSHGNDLTEFNFNQEIWDDPVAHLNDFDPNLGTGLLLRNSDRNRIVGNTFAENAKDGIYLDSNTPAISSKPTLPSTTTGRHQQPGDEHRRRRQPGPREHLVCPVPGDRLRRTVTALTLPPAPRWREATIS